MIKPILESSLLEIPDGTIFEMQVFKPHAGKIQFIAVAPDGRYKVLFDWTLNTQLLIDQNMKGEKLKPIPKDHPTNHHIFVSPKPKNPPEK